MTIFNKNIGQSLSQISISIDHDKFPFSCGSPFNQANKRSYCPFHIFLQIKRFKKYGRTKLFCHGIFCYETVSYMVGYYCLSFDMPPTQLILLSLRDLLLDMPLSNGMIQVVTKQKFPVNCSTIKINLKILWQDITRIISTFLLLICLLVLSFQWSILT